MKKHRQRRRRHRRRHKLKLKKFSSPEVEPTSRRAHLRSLTSEQIKLMFNYKSEYTIRWPPRGSAFRRPSNIPLLLLVFASIMCLTCVPCWPMSPADHQAAAAAAAASQPVPAPPPPPPPLLSSSEYEDEDEGVPAGGELAPPAVVVAGGPRDEFARNDTTRQLAAREEEASDFFYLNSLFSHIDKQWKFAEMILIIVISAILNLVTIIGNIMVLISFKMDRSLQTVSNYFLLSLALADLLIGLISMPLYTLYLLLNYWPLGPLMCDIWLAIDYLNSNAAVLNMLIISFDRYFSVTRPLTYRAKRTTKHAILMISGAWIFSLTIWTPAIFTYPYFKGRTVQGTDKCEIEFVKANTYLTFVTAILAFYIPVIIMIYLYWRIWLETKKRYRDLTTLFLVSGVGAAAHTRPHHRATPLSSSTAGIGSTANVIRRTGSTKSQNVREVQTVPAKCTQSSQAKQQQQQPPGDTRDDRQVSLIAAAGVAKSQQVPSKSEATLAAEGQRKARGKSGTEISGQLEQQTKNESHSKAPKPFVCRCSGCPKSATPASAHKLECPKCPAVDLHFESSQANCKLCKEQQIAAAQTGKCKSSSRHGHHHGHHHQSHHSKRAQSSGCCSASYRKGSPLCCSCCCSSCCNNNTLKRQSRREKHQYSLEQQAGIEEKNAAAKSRSPFWFGGSSTQINNNNHSSTNSLVSCAQSAAQSASRHHKIHPQTLSICQADESKPNEYQQQQQQVQKPPPADESKGPEVDGTCKTNQHSKTLVDVATSPIDSSRLSLWPLFNSNSNSHLEEQEDCETRIVSAGDRLKFETNDPKLGPKQRSTDSKFVANVVCPMGSSPALCQSSKSSCKLLTQTTVTHHHRNNLQQNCSCAEAMSAHDAECRLCRPSTRPKQQLLSRHHHHNHHHHHNPAHHHHHHHHSHHHHHGGHHSQRHSQVCKLCKQDEQTTRQAVSSSQQDEDLDCSGLPILGALQVQQQQQQQQPERTNVEMQSQPLEPSLGSQEARHQTQRANDTKKPKKFSQKLTFSDILVEQANVQRELSREQERRELMRSNELRMKFADESDDRLPSPANAEHDSRFNWFKRLIDPIRLGSGPKSILRDDRCSQDDNLSSPENNNKASSNRLLNAISGSKSLISLPIKGISSKLSGSMPLVTNQQQAAKYNNKSLRASQRNSSEDSDHSHSNQRRSSISGNGNGHHLQGKPSYSSHHPIQPKSERKAAKTLSTLLLVFIVTWLPYNILVLIKTLSGGEDQVPEKIWNFSYYLCYINSTINPLCYALCNAQFRRTYMRILKCKLSNDQHNSTRRLLVPVQGLTTWNKDLRLNSDAGHLGGGNDGNGHHHQHARGSHFQASGSSGHSVSFNGGGGRSGIQ